MSIKMHFMKDFIEEREGMKYLLIFLQLPKGLMALCA